MIERIPLDRSLMFRIEFQIPFDRLEFGALPLDEFPTDATRFLPCIPSAGAPVGDDWVATPPLAELGVVVGVPAAIWARAVFPDGASEYRACSVVKAIPAPTPPGGCRPPDVA